MDAHQLIMLITVFVLAVFLGFELISRVPPTLHTPLMSGSNAISGITLVGAMRAGVEEVVSILGRHEQVSLQLAATDFWGNESGLPSMAKDPNQPNSGLTKKNRMLSGCLWLPVLTQ